MDYQQPKDIDKYPFPNLLGTNLFKANFFDALHDFNTVIKNNPPKFILGNPPWKSKKEDVVHVKWLKDNKKTVGRFEIAQSFLLRTKDFMIDETKSALIITSTIFYNVSAPTRKFKEDFLTSFCVEKFFDLSPVRRLIFEKKNSPASIVYYRLSKDNDYQKNIINHQSVKFNRFIKYFKMLVVEKFDQKDLAQKYFLENDWMFKVALYGGILDFKLLNALKKLDGVNITNHFKEFNYGAGIKSNKGSDYAEKLIGLPLLENEQIKAYYTKIDENHILSAKDVWFESGRKPELFFGNKILIKEQAKDETDILISYVEGNSVYKNGINGITSPKKESLMVLFSYLISRLYEYYIFMISGSWGTSTRPQIRWKEEYLSFPIVDYSKEKGSVLIDLVNKFLQPIKDYRNSDIKTKNIPFDTNVLSKINNIINNLYEIKDYEKDLIDYTLNVSRYQFQQSKQHLVTNFNDSDHRNQKQVLEKYVDVYIKEFEEIYYDEFVKVEIFTMRHFIAMNFIITDKKPKEKISYPKNTDEKDVLERLANNLSIEKITDIKDSSKNLYIQKDIKGFESDSFYIIKPNEYKCWHRAMAWYDVAEFKQAIQEAELKRLNNISAND